MKSHLKQLLDLQFSPKRRYMNNNREKEWYEEETTNNESNFSQVVENFISIFSCNDNMTLLSCTDDLKDIFQRSSSIMFRKQSKYDCNDTQITEPSSTSRSRSQDSKSHTSTGSKNIHLRRKKLENSPSERINSEIIVNNDDDVSALSYHTLEIHCTEMNKIEIQSQSITTTCADDSSKRNLKDHLRFKHHSPANSNMISRSQKIRRHSGGRFAVNKIDEIDVLLSDEGEI